MPFSIIPNNYQEVNWGDIKGNIMEQHDLNNAMHIVESNAIKSIVQIITHTWTLYNGITSSDLNQSKYKFYLMLPGNETAILKGVDFSVDNGSVYFKLKLNDNYIIINNPDIIDSKFKAESEHKFIEIDDIISIVNNDRIEMELIGIEGNPENLSVEIHFFINC